MGDIIDIRVYDGKVLTSWRRYLRVRLRSDVLLDEVRAGGRINLIIGLWLDRQGTGSAGLGREHLFRKPDMPEETMPALPRTEDGGSRLRC